MTFAYPENITAQSGDVDFQTSIQTLGIPLQADAAKNAGGGGTAPDPDAYLLTALAACTCITVEMYVRHKGWPEVKVSVSLNLELARQEGAPMNRIHRSLRLDGEMELPQRERLLAIANNCPVHRILRHTFEIVTVLE